MIKFVKMEGLGNDFILFDATKDDLSKVDFYKLAPKLCDRHFGIGADGLLIVHPSEKANFRMQVINPDGSEPEMCGNGIRCFALYLYKEGNVVDDILSVETLAGTILPALDPDNGIIEVDMGTPILAAKDIPTTDNSEKVINKKIKAADKEFELTAVSMGNPHGVIFVDDVKNIDLTKYGSALETDPFFPERANIEFVEVISPTETKMRVWERGAGETLACGTGACATVVAGVLTGKIERKVLVHLAGGDLEIEWSEESDHLMMSGPAREVFRGEVKL